MKIQFFLLAFIFMVGIVSTLSTQECGSCNKANQMTKDEQELKAFIDEHLKVMQPLSTKMNLADWNASATGEKKYYDEKEKLEVEVRKIYSQKEDFAKLSRLKREGKIEDHLLKRQLIVLYNQYFANQMDPELMKEIVKISTLIQNKFNTFRGKIDNKEVSDNDILEILKNEKDSEKRKKAWEASKQVGKEISADLLNLIRLRNQVAQKLGYKNHYEMAMALDEQSVDEVIPIFDKLKEKTDRPFQELKKKIDEKISQKLNVPVESLRAWHYEDPFFQKVPQVMPIDFDKFYEKNDVRKLGEDFYKGINMDVAEILNKSDLYERKDKYPHAFCTDIDREGDIRVMLNIKPDKEWMETMLHELGHAVYYKYIDQNLPYLIKNVAHTFTTEAIAQLFERQATNPHWMQKMLGITDQQKEEIAKIVKAEAQLKALIFCRWSLVMVNFEKSMYENPDQDLNKLWWDMVEKYQFVKRPEKRDEPDYAAKIHLSQSPVYYHNYVLGELMASQLVAYMVKNIEKQNDASMLCFYKKEKLGDYLKEKVFMPGLKYHWNEMIKNATGEYLNPDYYIEEFVK